MPSVRSSPKHLFQTTLCTAKSRSCTMPTQLSGFGLQECGNQGDSVATVAPQTALAETPGKVAFP